MWSWRKVCRSVQGCVRYHSTTDGAADEGETEDQVYRGMREEGICPITSELGNRETIMTTLTKQAAHFKVDPRLAALLGETYRSTEQALKELVDNAWDADAENVWIGLPSPMTGESIIIRDDGTGMTEQELRKEYLVVARDRRSRKGELTNKNKRHVKGRKGIGKFAGLMAADVMTLITSARGIATNLTIPKQEILATEKDLEKIDLPVMTSECDPTSHGTTITLSHLNQSLSFPDADSLRQLLILEYGRETDFRIYVDDVLLGIEDLPGESFNEEINLSGVGIVRLHFKIADGKQKLKNTGIVVRVDGKIVGKPGYFGLEKADDIPRKLLQKVYGEIEADGLADDVTADWGAIIENSKAFRAVEEWVRPNLRKGIEKVYKTEINLANARLQKQLHQRLSTLPEHRRKYARAAIEKIMTRFYGESVDRIATVANVVIDALERDEYWQVLEHIDKARHGDVEKFAEALADFGLVEIAVMAQQAVQRLRFLDYLDELITNDDTLEISVHKALEKCLWVIGDEYHVITSNKTLAKTVEDHLNKKFVGERAQKRPDLLLADVSSENQLLIEFKRPSHTLVRDDKNQAEMYRDDLLPLFSKRIDIMVLGGKRKPDLASEHENGRVKLMTYRDVISRARVRLEWLVKELSL